MPFQPAETPRFSNTKNCNSKIWVFCDFAVFGCFCGLKRRVYLIKSIFLLHKWFFFIKYKMSNRVYNYNKNLILAPKNQNWENLCLEKGSVRSATKFYFIKFLATLSKVHMQKKSKIYRRIRFFELCYA